MTGPSRPKLGFGKVEFYRDMAILSLGQIGEAAFSITRVQKRANVIDAMECHNHTGEACMPLDGDILCMSPGHPSPGGAAGSNRSFPRAEGNPGGFTPGRLALRAVRRKERFRQLHGGFTGKNLLQRYRFLQDDQGRGNQNHLID